MTSKKMRIPSIFKNKEAKQLWQWPSCKHPKTLSFRATNDDVFKTVNSIFLDAQTPESLFTNSSEPPRRSTEDFSHEENNHNPRSRDSLETIIRGVRLSERLFFEPVETNSIMKEAKTDEKCDKNDSTNGVLPFKESVAMALESDDPYLDFKKSMQEMVESHGLKDWEGLEELLGWYLRMNGKTNHGFIVGAFVDLLMGLDHSNNSSDSDSSRMAVHCSDEYQNSTWYSSAASSFSSSSSCFSPRYPKTGVLGHHQRVVDCEDENPVVPS